MRGQDLIFDFPRAGYLLVFVFLLLYLFISLSRYRQSVSDMYGSALHEELTFPRSRGLTRFKNIAFISAWICLCLALAGPKGNVRYLDTDTGSGNENNG